MDELSTQNSRTKKVPSCAQTDFERANPVYDSKLAQIETKIRALEARYAQVVSDSNRFSRGYEERNGTIAFDDERASDAKNEQIKLGIQGLVEQEKELRMFRYAYAQVEKTLDFMATEVGKEEGGRDRTSTFKIGNFPVLRDHGHCSELQQIYRSNIEKQQKMQDALKAMECAFHNGLVDYELEIHRYFEKKFTDVEVKLMRVKEHLEMELRNSEESLARFEIKSLLLFILLSTITFYISLHQLVTWAQG